MTQGPDEVQPGPQPEPVPWPWRRRRWLFGIAAAVVAVPLYVASLVQVPYYLLSPGEARSVTPLISVGEGTPVFEPEGEILFTTVSLASKVNVYDAVRGWLDDDIEVVPEEQITGGSSREEVKRANIEAMDNSKLVATQVALEQLGLRVDVEGSGAEVTTVVIGSPADGKLEPLDVITAVDGQPITFHTQAVSAVRQRKPGDVVSFTLQRNGAEMTTQITATDGGDGVARIGVELRTYDLTYKFPVDVDIDTGLVSGPSAGLAFALAILDELTPGEMTGNRNVAVTGTIDAAGNVGVVGGVPQKTVTARREGADIFLVPPQEVELARPYARDMQIIGVKTLAEALAALVDLGGTGVALPSPDEPPAS
ncbi:MAG: YlbL family protein [Acidimicrobiia bacterium]